MATPFASNRLVRDSSIISVVGTTDFNDRYRAVIITDVESRAMERDAIGAANRLMGSGVFFT